MIKHISFDVWNTLITPNKAYGKVRNQLIAEHFNVDFETAKHVYKTCKGFLDHKAEEEGVSMTTKTNWLLLSDKIGNTSDKNIEVLIEKCNQAFIDNPPTFDQDLKDELLKLVDEGYELSIKSNTNFTSGAVLKNVLFDKVGAFTFQHYSDEWGLAKPSKTFFMATEHSSKIYNPKEIMHVGDNLICDAGCENLGWTFAYVENPQNLLSKLKNGEIFSA